MTSKGLIARCDANTLKLTTETTSGNCSSGKCSPYKLNEAEAFQEELYVYIAVSA